MNVKTLSGLQSVVFDLDGTLIDSVPDVAAALNRTLSDHGRQPLSVKEVRGLVGHGARFMLEQALLLTGGVPDGDGLDQAIDLYIRSYKASPAGETKIYDGVEATLQNLSGQGLKIGICSNKPSEMVEVVLRALDLRQWFDATTGGDDVAYKKPDGRHLLETLDRMKADPASTIFVGDSRNDFEAARDAGIPSVAVTFGYARDVNELNIADYRIDRIEELISLVAG